MVKSAGTLLAVGFSLGCVVPLIFLANPPAFADSKPAPVATTTSNSLSLLSTAQLSALYEQRAEKKDEILKLIESHPVLPSEFAARIWLSRLAYFSGFFGLPEDASDKRKMNIFQVGLDAAQAARAQSPQSVEGHYWYAVCLGGYSLAKGIMASLGNAEPMRQALDEAVRLDSKYEHGGPLRVRGRLYFKLPGGFISFGDNKKAYEDIKKALEIGPELRLNYIYFAEVQAKIENDEAALKTLEAGKKIPDIVGPIEESHYKKELAALEKKLK